MSASILQLITSSQVNSIYNIPRNLAIEYFTEEFNNGSFDMSRTCDTKLPEYLEIELSPNITIDNFKTISHKVCLEMTIGESKILSIPLRFMIHLKNYEICDNKIYITIPFEIFCSEIKLICISYHEVRFILTNIENNFTSCKLISNGIYYDTDIRRSLSQSSSQEIIQQLSSTEITSPNQRNEFKYIIPFDGIHKGFYIECENVDEINEISLKLNGEDRFIHNRFLVRTKCVKINQQLLYLPMNFDKSYDDRTPSGFEGSINLTRFDSAILNIKLDRLNSKICFYGLGSNILRTIPGMTGLAFYNSNINHYYCNYQENGYYIENSNRIMDLVPNIQSQTITETTENIIYKLITDNNKIMCCITHQDFVLNDRYMNCSSCNNSYNEESLKQWFRQRPHRKTCPMCRVNWTDFNIYINSEELNDHVVLDTPVFP